MNINELKTVEDFHRLYHSNGSRTWSGNTKWLGNNILKCPLDLWVYQEIIYNTKPDIIIECGTGDGGCSLFLAHISDLIGLNSKILSIDTENTNHIQILPKHDKIIYITGSSISENVITEVREHIKFPIKQNIMVILDSDHHKEHVLKELQIYSRFIRPGNYLIVEDTNLSSHPMYSDFEGPWEAVEEFLSSSDNNNGRKDGNNNKFVVDSGMEKFYMTFNPSGYLKRV